jgi:hypothetical protein
MWGLDCQNSDIGSSVSIKMKKLVNICREIHVKEFFIAFAVLFVSVVSGTTAAQAEKVNVSLVLKGGSSGLNPTFGTLCFGTL